jgi:hypothetical protein
MYCLIIIATLANPNLKWRFSDAMQIDKYANECRKQDKCLSKLKKLESGKVTYICKKEK